MHIRGKDPELKVYQEAPTATAESMRLHGRPGNLRRFVRDLRQRPKVRQRHGALESEDKVPELQRQSPQSQRREDREEGQGRRSRKYEEGRGESTELKEEQELNRLRRENLDLLARARKATEQAKELASRPPSHHTQPQHVPASASPPPKAPPRQNRRRRPRTRRPRQ